MVAVDVQQLAQPPQQLQQQQQMAQSQILSQLPQQIYYEAVEPSTVTANTQALDAGNVTQALASGFVTQPLTPEVSIVNPSTNSVQGRQQSDTKTSKEAEHDREEAKDADSEVDKQQTSTYRDRIKKVRQMLLGAVGDDDEVEIKTVLSMDKKDKLEKSWLPHSESFMSWFQEYNEAVEQKDKRDNSSTSKAFKIKMAQYRIRDNPWQQVPKVDTGLMESTILPDFRSPKVLWDMKGTDEMENSRDMLSVASYVDMFLWASKKMMKDMMEKLDAACYDDSPHLDFERIQDLYEGMEEATEFLNSGAIGLKDMVKGTVTNIGSLVIARRYAFIERMERGLSQQMKLNLWKGDINKPALFGEEKLEEVKKMITDNKSDKVQTQFLYHASNNRRQEHDAQRGRGRFRGHTRGRGRGHFGSSKGGGQNSNLWEKRSHTDKILEEERVVDLEKKSHWMEEIQQKDPVGGILAKYVQEWEKIADPLVLKIVAQGLKLEFLRTPVLVRDPQLSPLPKEQDKLQEIFQQAGMLLEKKVIERVWNTNSPGFYSRFFVVPKKQKGIWRAILDLRELNQDIVTEHFKMETAEQIQRTLNVGDWVTSIDFKDAYYHILIHPSYRKFLQFAIGSKVFQYRVLPMGLKSSPRVFTRVIKCKRFPTTERYRSTPILGRLADSGEKCETSRGKYKDSVETSGGFRFCNQPREIGVETYTTDSVFGHQLCTTRGNSTTGRRENCQVADQFTQVFDQDSTHSESVATHDWPTGSDGEVSTRRTFKDPTSAVRVSETVETRNSRSELFSESHTRSGSSNRMVGVNWTM